MKSPRSRSFSPSRKIDLEMLSDEELNEFLAITNEKKDHDIDSPAIPDLPIVDIDFGKPVVCPFIWGNSYCNVNGDFFIAFGNEEDAQKIKGIQPSLATITEDYNIPESASCRHTIRVIGAPTGIKHWTSIGVEIGKSWDLFPGGRDPTDPARIFVYGTLDQWKAAFLHSVKHFEILFRR